MTQVSPDMVDRAARAVHDLKFDSEEGWDIVDEAYREVYRRSVTVALTAALGDKYVIVPRRLSDAMIIAAIEAHERGKRGYTEQWDAMIAAATAPEQQQ